ncbi:MAG: GTP 3',8-cyclase MoaA [Spirochaetaceae bacterium]|nr:GTP 3',8-cyclase MoaA [Spirochaetaceae bacterium]
MKERQYREDAGGIRDSQGRLIDYLRVSVTDRCNLRCIYCMPEEGVEWRAHEDMLSFEELLRCCRVMAAMGIQKIKVTGGEPLVRRGTAGFIAALKALPGIRQVTLTTNGLLLEGELEGLRAAGLDGVNISLDSLEGETFRRITRRDGHEGILRVIRRAAAAGLLVKVNCVPLRGINDHELAAIAGLAREEVAAVRFIELMPLGKAFSYEPLTGEEIAAILERRYGKLNPFAGKLGNGPARYYSAEGFSGVIGFISPLSRCFCESCNRFRLTSQGVLKPCLSSGIGVDLRAPLRSGADDGVLREAVADAAARKPAQHTFLAPAGTEDAESRPREMFRIGG